MDTEDDDPPTGLGHSYEQQRRLEEPSFRRQANLSPEGQEELRGDFCPWGNTFSPRRGIQNGYNSASYYPCNGLAYSQEKLVEYEPKHQWTSHIHAKPNIHYAGIENKETKYRLHIDIGKNLKRKIQVTNSEMSPSRKQHITEEKMAACMQGLSLENQQVRGSVKNINDDSDFEDDSDIDDETIEEQSIDPVVELHVDLKESFKRMTTILPESIVENMVKTDSSNTAVVPYIPREGMFLKCTNDHTDEVVDRNESHMTDTQKIISSSDNKVSSTNWDSDSDNDLMLE